MRALALALVVGSLARAAAEPRGVRVDGVAALVDGVPILSSELALREAGLRREAAGLAGRPRSAADADAGRRALDSMIDEALMVAAARDRGIAISAAEVDRAIAEVERQNRLDRAGLIAALARDALTLESYREAVERQLLLIKVQQELILGAVLVSDAEVRAAYRRERDAKLTAETLEQARGRIQGELYQERLVAAMRRWLGEAREQAHIERRSP